MSADPAGAPVQWESPVPAWQGPAGRNPRRILPAAVRPQGNGGGGGGGGGGGPKGTQPPKRQAIPGGHNGGMPGALGQHPLGPAQW